MHQDHDHITDGEHIHEHTHSHTHEHTHDGVSHAHEHTHEHAHAHGHPHSHEHLHDADTPHEHSHSPMDELLALMKYMVGHNAAHTKELADLAERLKQADRQDAYEKVMAAVTDYEMGNAKLAGVLEELGAN